MTQVWVNGVLAKEIDPLDRAIAYGDGLFATMRIAAGEIQFLSAHLARLTQGAKRLGFTWFASQELQSLLKSSALTQVNGCVKLLLSRGVGGRGYAAPDACGINEVLSLYELPQHYAHWQSEGVSLSLSEVKLAKQPRLAGIKHLNRLEQVLIKSTALPSSFDDWLVLDSDSQVVESSMANLFFVKNKTVFTPAISHSGVAGVMREQLIFALVESGYHIDIKQISYADINKFDHCFMTNSLFGLVDVNRIGTINYSKYSLSDRLRNTLQLTL
ncbi:aminodeoxychorismate lyase [Shewanella woodyi]|uniref:Aminodeoxychorismate lyase n=1 Tax=Shewanella woodyi (strain ATCC 51908 / MS32) TaxID=392500 RepID=B1KQM5_SHEWM|nr:aminodeoxychorismate lyase [Shewanella woodyi]ACA86264.1 aminodeoxychorismate lyase [Shewanella woodyi ATCC 51908]